MKFIVQLLAFTDTDIREVEVPNDFAELSGDALLEQIFYFGQNDFQPQQRPSVSVGDVIELDSKYYLVKPMGFKEITLKQLIHYANLPREERFMSSLRDDDYLYK